MKKSKKIVLNRTRVLPKRCQKILKVLSPANVEMALCSIKAKGKALQNYCWIQENVRKLDISKDREFQRKYNGFYRVRRGADWRKCYYSLMRASKNKAAVFLEVLMKLKEKTGRVEASFASKLVATLDPGKPVIDSIVLKKFGLKLPVHGSRNRGEKVNTIYKELCEDYEILMNQSCVKEICRQFSKEFPGAKITDLKKIDLILWQTR